MTTQDMIAPGIRTADEHQIRVGAETVKLLQANIVEPEIQYFPSDLYAAQFDPTAIERLPNFCDAIRIVDQIVYQESKYSLYDFDVGPPKQSRNTAVREFLNGGIVWTYRFFSPLSL